MRVHKNGSNGNADEDWRAVLQREQSRGSAAPTAQKKAEGLRLVRGAAEPWLVLELQEFGPDDRGFRVAIRRDAIVSVVDCKREYFTTCVVRTTDGQRFVVSESFADIREWLTQELLERSFYEVKDRER